MDYAKVEVWIQSFDFEYVGLFKKKKKAHIDICNGCWHYIDVFGTYRSITTIENAEDKVKEYKEKANDELFKRLSESFKTFELTNIDFNVKVMKASEQTAKWCFENLTVQQLIDIGLTVIEK